MSDFKMFLEGKSDEMLQHSLDQIGATFGEIRQKEDQVKGIVTNLYQYLSRRVDSQLKKQLGSHFSALSGEMNRTQKALSDRDKVILAPDQVSDAVYGLQRIATFIEDPGNTNGLPVALYSKGLENNVFTDLHLEPDTDVLQQLGNTMKSRIVQFRMDRGDGKMDSVGPEFDVTNDDAVKAAMDAVASASAAKKQLWGKGGVEVRQRKAAEKAQRRNAQRANKGYTPPPAHLPPEITPTAAQPPIPLKGEAFRSWASKRSQLQE